MRHHSKYISVLIANTRDIRSGSVRVGLRSGFAAFVAIAENDLIIFLKHLKGGVIASVVPLGMGDRNRQDVAVFQLVCEWRVLVLDPDIDVFANKVQPGVSDQCPRKKPRFAKDLKAIAYSEDKFALSGKILNSRHHR